MRPALAFAVLLTVMAPVALAEAKPAAVGGVQTEMRKPAHAEFSTLLAKYVKSSPDGVNRFDYAGLQASPADRAALDAYIAQFAEADLSGTDGAAFATWTNLYNAVTVRYIVEKYPVKSIRDGTLIGPWKKIIVRAGGRTVSLDAIEHEILRPTFKDPRVHYAINCASYGCPNLLDKAWEAATLDADLDLAARAYVNHRRGTTVTARGLEVSEIYNWFQEDFGGSKTGVIDHLLKYASPELARQIRANPKIVKYRYDWSLNDASRKTSSDANPRR